MQQLKKVHDAPKQKERHIVTWSQQEDDILREQISIHGTENWAIIAAKFKDKTTRQCRRRWYTYLNSDFKKGGWSPEEDMLLCEAQRIYGNRWTEIAKVVSGRTDNAVKNRFSTLCKKRAKNEALAKENNTSYINTNNKRIIYQNVFDTDGTNGSAVPPKKTRTHISDHIEKSHEGRLPGDVGTTANQFLRPPFTVLVQNTNNEGNLPVQQHMSSNTISGAAVGANRAEGTFIKKDDPKITALVQQAELLSSLALKVNADNTSQSLENAWKELQDFLNRNKDEDLLTYNMSEMDSIFKDFKDLVEDMRSSNIGIQPSWRQPDLYESPGSSDYSTGSTLQSQTVGDKSEQTQAEVCSLHQDNRVELQPIHMGVQDGGSDGRDGVCNSTNTAQDIFHLCSEPTDNDGFIHTLSSTEFSSPLQVTPLFQSLAAGIPSPKFSESERNFLLKTLGLASSSPNSSINASQPPPCRRALLHSL